MGESWRPTLTERQAEPIYAIREVNDCELEARGTVLVGRCGFRGSGAMADSAFHIAHARFHGWHVVPYVRNDSGVIVRGFCWYRDATRGDDDAAFLRSFGVRP